MQNYHCSTNIISKIPTENPRFIFKKNIQCDSRGICTTLGNDSMSDSKQKISYENGSDFERLRSYDHLKLGIEGKDY